MDAATCILQQHAWCHAAAVGGGGPTTVDRLVDGLSADQLRARPAPGLNSIAWLLWHAARIEDAVINTIVADAPQVLTQDDWQRRLGLQRTDLGTGMDDAEVETVSAALEPGAVIAYRNAVGRRTAAVIAAYPAAGWDEPVSAARVHRAAAAAPGSGAWLEGAWLGLPASFFFAMPATNHNFLHLGEAWCVRTLLGVGGGR